MSVTDNEYLITVGKLAHNATVLDLYLFCAFKIVSRCEQSAARAIYFAFEAFSTKKQVINRILEAMADEQEKDLVKKMISATEKGQNQRNELAHVVAIKDAPTDDRPSQILNPRLQRQSTKPVSKPFLDSLMDESTAALVKAQAAFEELCQKRGIPPKLSL